MKRLLKEPLFHFVLIGAAIFAAYSLLSKHAANEPGKIVVSQGQIELLATGFARTWQRPPTEAELNGLVRDYVREEACAREAMAMGLDKDDTVIRRRLRQKLEFVSEDITAAAEPTDAELRTYLAAHPDAFRNEARYSFSQVYLKPGRDVAAALAQVKRGEAVAGDSVMLDHDFAATPASEVARLFGEKFAARLGELPVGKWQGPVESGYGAHLVLVRERAEGGLPTLEEARGAVRREWQNARRLEANEKFYQVLLKRYTVTIEPPKPAEQPKKLAEARR